MTLGFKKNHQKEPVSAVDNSFIYTSAPFADNGDIVFPGERPVHLLAAAPGGASLGASRREHADHDK